MGEDYYLKLALNPQFSALTILPYHLPEVDAA